MLASEPAAADRQANKLNIVHNVSVVGKLKITD